MVLKQLQWEHLSSQVSDKFTYKKSPFFSKELFFKPTKQEWIRIKKQTHKINFKITPRCNSQCKLCYDKGFPGEEMSLELFKKGISRLGKNKEILLIGGEPTVREDLLEFLKIIKKSGNIPVIYTNGLKFSDYNFAREVRAFCDRLIFSFDGLQKEIYSSMKGGEEQLDIKLRALSNLRRLGFKINLSVTIAKGINENSLPEIMEFAVKHRDLVKNVSISPAVPFGKVDLDYKPFYCKDIFEILSPSGISLEYYIEFKKLMERFSLLLQKFGKTFPSGGVLSMAPFMTERGLEPLIPLDDLGKLNRLISGRKYAGVIKMAFKYPKASFVSLLSLLSNKLFLKKMFNSSILTIYIGELSTPINRKNLLNDTIGVFSIGDSLQAGAVPTLD